MHDVVARNGSIARQLDHQRFIWRCRVADVGEAFAVKVLDQIDPSAQAGPAPRAQMEILGVHTQRGIARNDLRFGARQTKSQLGALKCGHTGFATGDSCRKAIHARCNRRTQFTVTVRTDTAMSAPRQR
jgi:hypothetical protein